MNYQTKCRRQRERLQRDRAEKLLKQLEKQLPFGLTGHGSISLVALWLDAAEERGKRRLRPRR